MSSAEVIIKVSQSEQYRQLSGTSTGKNRTGRRIHTPRRETKIAREEDQEF
jgi:hypothetical protein